VQVDEVPVSARKRYRVLPDPSTRIWPRGLEAAATTAPEEDGDAAGGEGLEDVVLLEEQAPVKRARTASAGTMNLFMTLPWDPSVAFSGGGGVVIVIAEVGLGLGQAGDQPAVPRRDHHTGSGCDLGGDLGGCRLPGTLGGDGLGLLGELDPHGGWHGGG